MSLKRVLLVAALCVAPLAAMAISCGSSGDSASCSTFCASQPACSKESEESCVATCAQQEATCASANRSADFQAFVDCASSLSEADYVCGSHGPQTTRCSDQALKLLECGRSGVMDGGLPDAEPAADRSEPDSSVPFYDGSVEPVTPCFQNQAFTRIPWAPPTALHQGSCTPQEIASYLNGLNGEEPFTSGSTSCDECLLTDVGAASHGPIVTQFDAPIQTNWGGCIANLDGVTAAGSCGDTFNNVGDCLIAQCGGCTDFPSRGANTQTCRGLAFAAGGRCEVETTTPECAAEIEPGGVAAECGPTVADLLTIWCGP
ncbi:hypothetical protein [Sorangium sp. So ce1000]|uniref:hypothetical protein n=1 Tax=Sorangium sp. So ce1000 TaxID=3133325 RepID=UPI003F5E1A99